MSEIACNVALVCVGTIVYLVSELVRSLERADEVRAEKAQQSH